MKPEAKKMSKAKELDKFYDLFFGDGYWEKQYKMHINEFAKQWGNKTLEDVEAGLNQEEEDAYEVYHSKESKDFNRGFNEAIRCAIIITRSLKL